MGVVLLLLAVLEILAGISGADSHRILLEDDDAFVGLLSCSLLLVLLDNEQKPLVGEVISFRLPIFDKYVGLACGVWLLLLPLFDNRDDLLLYTLLSSTLRSLKLSGLAASVNFSSSNLLFRD